MTRDEVVAYWIDSSDADFEVPFSLIEETHYYKNRFSRKATKEFAEKYMGKIKEFRLWLKAIMIPQ